MGRWLLGIIILAILALLYGLWAAPKYIGTMESDIQANLNAAGHDWAKVDMSGNIARLSGAAPTAEARASAEKIAKESECKKCKKDRRWHKVKSDIEVAAPALPTQSPYTFQAIKSETGRVVLSGYVPGEAQRDEVLAKARAAFGADSVFDRTIKVASGAPDKQWINVIDSNFAELSQLEQGRFQIEDTNVVLTGTAATQDVQDRVINAVRNNVPQPYSGAGNVSVTGGSAQTAGEIRSQAVCQTLLDDLKQGKKINFEQGQAVIRGEQNFNLLNDISGAAKQCPSFQIAINGYTSSEGSDAMNQVLSQRRADAVLAYLTGEQDIARSRLTARGYGEANPIATNETPSGREQNRRIEFVLSRGE